jgi:hypothetical protein
MSDLLSRIITGSGQKRCIKDARTLDNVQIPYDTAGYLGTQLLLPFVLKEDLPPGGSANATIRVFDPMGASWTYEARVYDDFGIGFYGSAGARGVVFKYYNGPRRRPGALSEAHPVDKNMFRHAIVNMQCGTIPPYNPGGSPGGA